MYRAPTDQIAHALSTVGRLGELVAANAHPVFDQELVRPVLEQAGHFVREVLAPLNAVGHERGARLDVEGVRSPPGFPQAYRKFCEAGLMSLAFPVEYGGQGYPKTIALSVMEMVHATNMAFGLCPILNFGAIDALLAHGNEQQKRLYVPKLVSGEWTSAMNLTEPHAGSDVGALRAQAEPNADGSYAISGQKIFISWADHDMAENIIQLVLARLPGAPTGAKGISLFLAPKFLPMDDGSLGQRNTFDCIGIERKIGIHGAPTCVMQFSNAKGWLVGEPNKGLAAMFTMMNSARLNVALQGVGVSEAALQTAVSFANERRQGTLGHDPSPVPIVQHPDVRRMLAKMATTTQAARALCYACAGEAELATHAATIPARDAAKLREDLLTPIAKAWATDRAVDIAHLGLQIHGGLGYMHEAAAAQLLLDVRITPIYEGTNGIQAIDLVGRKVAGTNGASIFALISDVNETARAARNSDLPELVAVADKLDAAATTLHEATKWMIATMASTRELALSGAGSYLELAGDVAAGHYLTQQALAPDHAGSNQDRLVAQAYFFAQDTLSGAPAALARIVGAAVAVSRGPVLWEE